MTAVEHKILLKVHDALCSTLTLLSLSGVRSNHLSYRPASCWNENALRPLNLASCCAARYCTDCPSVTRQSDRQSQRQGSSSSSASAHRLACPGSLIEETGASVDPRWPLVVTPSPA